MGISKINHNFVLKLHYKFSLHTSIGRQEYHTCTRTLNNKLLAVKKVSDCPLTLSELVPKIGVNGGSELKTDQHRCDQN